MKIPSKFKLFGQTIIVTSNPNDFSDSDGLYGFACYRKNEIQLRPSTDIFPINSEQMEQTFWHELTHFVLYHAGSAYSGKKDYMHQEEGFVELVASLFHQAINSFEY